MDPSGSITWIRQEKITWIHQDPSHRSTRIHHVNPPGSIPWIHQDPSRGSIMWIHQIRIHQVDPSCGHQDPSGGSTRNHQVDQPGSITWIHRDPSCGSMLVKGEEARDIQLLLFETFSFSYYYFFFFTRAIPRGARAPKNYTSRWRGVNTFPLQLP